MYIHRQENLCLPQLRSSPRKRTAASPLGPSRPRAATNRRKIVVKHGLSSTRVVIAGESQEEWDSLLGGFITQFQPQGEIEAELVFEMEACLWRLRRASTLETLLLNTEIEKFQNEPEPEPVDLRTVMPELSTTLE